MPINQEKDLTLEEVLKKEQDLLNKNKESNEANIAKMEGRLAEAKKLGDQAEIARLQGLVDLHKEHKKTLAAIDVNKNAQEKFEKLVQRQAKLEVPAAEPVVVQEVAAPKASKK